MKELKSILCKSKKEDREIKRRPIKNYCFTSMESVIFVILLNERSFRVSREKFLFTLFHISSRKNVLLFSLFANFAKVSRSSLQMQNAIRERGKEERMQNLFFPTGKGIKSQDALSIPLHTNHFPRKTRLFSKNVFFLSFSYRGAVAVSMDIRMLDIDQVWMLNFWTIVFFEGSRFHNKYLFFRSALMSITFPTPSRTPTSATTSLHTWVHSNSNILNFFHFQLCQKESSERRKLFWCFILSVQELPKLFFT